MSDWVDNLIKEDNELTEKITKLRKYLETANSPPNTPEHQHEALLMVQLGIMESYERVLGCRIDLLPDLNQ